jgi:FkbM family methyltransferase
MGEMVRHKANVGISSFVLLRNLIFEGKPKMARVLIREGLSFDIPSNLLKIYQDFEPMTTRVISEALKEGETFLDIGANFGYFSLLASSIVGDKGCVYSVEASPEVWPPLIQNTQDFTNIRPINSAVGARKGETEFYLTEDFVNSGVAMSPFLANAKKVILPIDTIDNLLSQFSPAERHVDFIKCDVQGDEIAVLQGAEKTIRESENLRLIIEWAPAWMKRAGFDPSTLPDLLFSLGFTSVVVVDDWLKKILSLEDMMAEFAKDTTGKRFCNLYATKQ